MTAEDFFFKHAGYSYDPKTETAEDGKRRGARELAQAEQWAQKNDVTFVWQPDWDIGSHVREFETYDQEPETCESCIAYDSNGVVVASLHCIDDATTEYRRVIEAELASEVQSDQVS